MVKRSTDLYAGEANLARRVEKERRSRGWSYEALAEKMTAAGCPIRKAALQRIEKGNGPGKDARQIAVDELVALARVFELEVDDLLTPMELIDQTEARDVVHALIESNRQMTKSFDAMIAAYERYARMLAGGSRELVDYIDGHVLKSRWSYTRNVERISDAVSGPGRDVEDFTDRLARAFQVVTTAAQTIGVHRALPEANAETLIEYSTGDADGER